jgi:hypothetical protein
MTGKTILAKDPAEANHPNNTPCGRRPTTMLRIDKKANECETTDWEMI